jgi:hypothetical protein
MQLQGLRPARTPEALASRHRDRCPAYKERWRRVRIHLLEESPLAACLPRCRWPLRTIRIAATIRRTLRRGLLAGRETAASTSDRGAVAKTWLAGDGRSGDPPIGVIRRCVDGVVAADAPLQGESDRRRPQSGDADYRRPHSVPIEHLSVWTSADRRC